MMRSLQAGAVTRVVVRGLAAVAAAMSLTAIAATASGPIRIPLEHIFSEPEIRSVQLSPDGKYAAFLSTLGTGRVGVALLDLATGKVEPLVSARDENLDFFSWKGPDRVVFGGDRGGNESTALRVIRLHDRRVTSLAASFVERYADRANQAVVLDWLRHEPNFILIYGNQEVGSYNFGVYRLDVRTGNRNKIAEVSEGSGFVADRKGAILARIRLSGREALHEVRDRPGGAWRVAARTPEADSVFPAAWRLTPLAIDSAAGLAYVTTRTDTDTEALRRCSLATGELGPVLFHSPAGDIDAVILSYDGSRLLGVMYTTDRPRYHWFDAQRAELQQKIDASLPGSFNRIVDSTPDETLRVVVATSDRMPPAYYLLNLKSAQPALMLLGRWHGKLDPAQLVEMRPVQYPARDGLPIHGYVTMPPGVKPGERVPLLVLPHGGPFGIRDVWGFSDEGQFFANRGYAVLQPNYRGSGGYGLKFMAAGKREWAGKMQDDLTDGVKWAVAEGWADPDRVAIYGASYGGFAALAGVAFTPELYRCAINYAGPADLTMLAGYPLRHSEVGELYAAHWVGATAAELRRRSPLYHVDQMKVPTLHIYGENDPRVDIRHWRALEKMLKQHHRNYDALRDENEGHGFTNESSRIQCYRRIEDFLAKNLASPALGTPGKN